jgi:hypothetical protein
MFNIKVEKVLEKDIYEVFDILTDHENYNRFRALPNSKLLKHGRDEKNGLDAVRFVQLGSMKFEERITHFERPKRFDYLVIKSSPLKINHDGGSVHLESIAQGTKVTWITRGCVAIPLLGRLLDKVMDKQGPGSIKSILKQIEQV